MNIVDIMRVDAPPPGVADYAAVVLGCTADAGVAARVADFGVRLFALLVLASKAYSAFDRGIIADFVVDLCKTPHASLGFIDAKGVVCVARLFWKHHFAHSLPELLARLQAAEQAGADAHTKQQAGASVVFACL